MRIRPDKIGPVVKVTNVGCVDMGDIDKRIGIQITEHDIKANHTPNENFGFGFNATPVNQVLLFGGLK